MDDSAPVNQYSIGFGVSGLDESASEIAASPQVFTSYIADSLLSGVGMLVVIPVLVGGIAVVMSVLMFRSGRFDGDTITPYIALVAVSAVVSIVAVALIYMISNVFVPVT